MTLRLPLLALLLGLAVGSQAADAPADEDLTPIARPLPPVAAPAQAEPDPATTDAAALDAPAPPPPPIDLDYRPSSAPHPH